MDDLQAIRRLKNGDIGGLEVLVARYQARAVRVAFLITHDEALAEDVVQETFVRLYRRIGGFDSTRPFEPYLLRSVANAALNVTRNEDRQVSLDGGPEQVEQLLTQAASVESEVEYRQLKQEIIQALFRLDPRQRAVLVQRYYLEMSEKEMAAALDAPLTITLPEVSVNNTDTFHFSLDVGSHPIVGQAWQLNQTVRVGGHSFLAERVTLEDRGYTLTFRSLTPISREDLFLNVTIEEKDASLLSERIRERDGMLEVTQTLVYDEPPTGALTFTLNLFVMNSIGPWSLTWSPPNSP